MNDFFSSLIRSKMDSRETKYKCECLDCGYLKESTKHCRDIKCPECGGKMRREDKPGIGK